MRLWRRLLSGAEPQWILVSIDLRQMLIYIHNSIQSSSSQVWKGLERIWWWALSNKINLVYPVHRTWASCLLKKWGVACHRCHQECKSYRIFRNIFTLSNKAVVLQACSKVYIRHSRRTINMLNTCKNSSKMRRHSQWLSRATHLNPPSNSYL